MVKLKTCGYYVASRDFSPSEVKLLAEIVRESKIVTKKEAKRLIEKMQCLTSDYEWREIVRIPKRKSDITDS